MAKETWGRRPLVDVTPQREAVTSEFTTVTNPITHLLATLAERDRAQLVIVAHEPRLVTAGRSTP
jgi:hypothetical protein